MSKNSDEVMGRYFKLPNPGLRSYFGNVVAGQPEVYRGAFQQHKTVEEVLNEWSPYVDSCETEWPSLVQFENDLRAKVGPMSVMKPLNERLDDIDSYYDGVRDGGEPILERAILATNSWFKGVRVAQPRTQWSTVANMRLSTNSGSPFFQKRRNVVKDTVPVTLERPYEIFPLSHGSNAYEYAAVLGWRGQEGGPSPADVKQRVVWMFPFGVNIAELSVYQAIIQSCQSQQLVPAWVSMESVDQAVTRLFDTKGRNDLIVCTDFTKFDQHFGPAMQDAAEKVLRRMCGHGVDEWFYEVFPIKYEIPLAYDWGKIRYGRHGMASGSGGTNVDETLSHRSLQFEAAIDRGARLNPNSQCLGDDGILSYPGIDVEDVTRSYSRHGLEMNPSKQSVSAHECTYLRRWHHQDYRVNGVCVGVYSTYRAIGRLMYQERYYDPDTWNREMVALRELSIIENCKYHPRFKEFVEFCMERDKFRLGLDIPGFIDNITRKANEAIELMPDFLGYTKSLQGVGVSGIAEWKVVQILKSKV